MIQNLEIENFKSIKHLQLPCKKVNVFIGEPNAGKSNVIEALSLFLNNSTARLREVIRFHDLTDLFYNNQIDDHIKITTADCALEIEIDTNNPNNVIFNYSKNNKIISSPSMDVGGGGILSYPGGNPKFKLYKFKTENPSNSITPGSLSVPFGDNLISVIITNRDFEKLVKDIFQSKGFRLLISRVKKELMITKEGDDIYPYPYSNVSETLQRIIFLMAALETNSDSILMFDEPEANMFPFYIKYFAERLAYDETNQYFFTTHNASLVNTIISKVKTEDLNICLTYMDKVDYQTKVHVMTADEIIELADSDMDITLNLNRFLEME